MQTKVLILEHGRGHGGSMSSLTRLLQALNPKHFEILVLLDSYDVSTNLLASANVPALLV